MKTVLITGASRGIGRACALEFAKNGYTVFLNYCKNEAAVRETMHRIESMGAKAKPIPADITDRGAVFRMAEEIGKTAPHLDVLINNAGIAQQKLFTDITPQEWEAMFATNITGMFHVTQAVLPGMIHEKCGRIINLSSIWGIAGASCEVHYSASKAAVIGFTKALAKELGPSGITVNCIAPGVIDTDMNELLDNETLEALREETPLGTIGTPGDIAKTAAFLASDGASFITGQVLSPNGGFVI